MLGILSGIPMGKVTKSLLVCATPRSGSTLLCALLDGTGVAGPAAGVLRAACPLGPPAPAARVLRTASRTPNLLELLAPTDPGSPDPGDPIPQALADGTTDNGVFAAKLMWTHLLDLAERLGRPADAALLRERFPDPRYVHVTRRDKVAQAVSLWRAVQTRAWRAGEVTENGNAVYHAGAIGYLAGQLTDHDDAWRSVVRRQPHRAADDRLRGARRRHERRHRRGDRPPRRRAGRDPRAPAAPAGRRPLRALGGALPRMSVSELDRLEAESIHVMREVAAELERPVLLFSGGKDSLVLLQLAREGVPPRRAPVPGPARRHRPQLPRGDRVPRPPDRRRSASS